MNYCDLGFRNPHPCEFLVQILTISKTETAVHFFVEDIAGNTASISLEEKPASEFVTGFNKVYPNLVPLTWEHFDSEHPNFKFLPSYNSINLRAPLNHYVIKNVPQRFEEIAEIHPCRVYVYDNCIGGALDYNAYMMLGLTTRYASMPPDLLTRFKADTSARDWPAGDMDVWVFFTHEQVEQINSFLNL